MSGVSFKVTAETAQADARLAEINKTLVQIKGSANSLSNSLTNAFRNIAATVSIGAVAVMMKNISDNAISLENRMKTIADSSADVAKAMKTVKDLSMETRGAVSTTAELYQRFSKAAETLAADTEDVLKVTRLTSQAIQLSGTAAESAAAAVIQLGQGLGSGVLRGEELNSVLEQAPRLAQAIANGLGVGVQQLRNMGQQGVLTSEAVFNSLLSQASVLQEEFGRTTFTMSQQLINLKTAAGTFGAEVMKGFSGGGGGLGAIVANVADMIYAKAETVQSSVSLFVSSVKLHFGEIALLAGSVSNVAGALFRNFSDAVPSINTSRTLIKDLYGLIVSLTNVMKSAFKEPMRELSIYLRESAVSVETLFGLFDFEVPKAMRELFDARSIVDFTKAFNHLAAGIDGNTNFILNRLSAIPRTMRHGIEDVAIYLGILDKPLKIRAGYFEPLRDSIAEISGGLKYNIKWLEDLHAALMKSGAVISYVVNIFKNLFEVIKAGALIAAAGLKSLLKVFSEFTDSVGKAAKDFNETNTFIDIFVSSEDKLRATLYNIKYFAKQVIQAFFEIWDAVIGHSWWTDTINSIVSTSESLWDRSSSGLTRFSKNTQALFKGLYEDRPVHDMLATSKAFLTTSAVSLKVAVGNVDFVDLGIKIKDALIGVFSNLKQNYKDILETAGIGLLFMGIVSLFPASAIAQMISAKAALAIGVGMAVVSDRLVSQVTGGSPLGAIATTMGEVLGRELWRFINNIPQILNSALGLVIGFFKGFVAQIPLIGDFLKPFLAFDGFGDILGLVGTLFFGKSALKLFNTLGLITTTPQNIATMFSRVFALSPVTGLVGHALFGSSGTAIIGLMLLIEGAFDNMLGNSTTLKVIAGGGLMWMLIHGLSGGPGRLYAPILGFFMSFGAHVTTAIGWLSSFSYSFGFAIGRIRAIISSISLVGLWATLTAPGVGGTLTQWQIKLMEMRTTWRNFVASVRASNLATVFTDMFVAIGQQLTILKAKFATFYATPGGKLATKIGVGAAVGALAMFASGSAKADEIDANGNPAPKPIRGTSVLETMAGAISDAFAKGLEFIKDNVVIIMIALPYISTIAGTIISAIGGMLSWIGTIASGIMFLLEGATLKGALAGLVLLVGGPISAFVVAIAAFVAGSALLIEFFGEGDTFLDKLWNTAVKIRRLFGGADKELVPDTQTKIVDKFSAKALTAAERLDLTDPRKLDYSKIDWSAQSETAKRNIDNYSKQYNNALEQVLKEKENNPGGIVSASTWSAFDLAKERFTAALDKMANATSKVDPGLAMGKWLETIPRTKNIVEAPFGGMFDSLQHGALTMTSNVHTSRSGYATSAEAETSARQLEKMENDLAMARERQAHAWDRVSIFEGKLEYILALKEGNRLSNAYQNALPAYVQPGFTGLSQALLPKKIKDSAEAFSYASKLKEIEVAQQSTDYKLTLDMSGFEGQVDKIQKLGAIALTNARNLQDKEQEEQLAGMYEELRKKREAVNNPNSTTTERKSNLEIAKAFQNSAVETLTRMTSSIQPKQLERLTYQNNTKSLIADANNAGYKIDEKAFPVMGKDEEEAFKARMTALKGYRKELADASNAEEVMNALRNIRAEEESSRMFDTIAAVRAEKGERAALLEVTKNLSNSKLIEKVTPRLTDANARGFADEQTKILDLKGRLEETTRRRVKEGESEDKVRGELTDEVNARQLAFDRGLMSLLSPREAILQQAETLGITLNEYVIKGLGTANGIKVVQGILNKAQAASDIRNNVPTNAPASVRQDADAGVVKANDAANKALDWQKPKMFSELISLIGVQLNDLLSFDKVDFKFAVNAAKDLDKVEVAISKLGPAAEKSEVDKLLNKKLSILKDVAEKAAKYAYNTVGKVAAVFDGMGLSGATVTPALQGVVVQLSKMSDENKRLAETDQNLANVPAYLAREQALKRMKEYITDISSSTFGDQLDRVNSSLKLSLSEESFNDLGDKVRAKLNSFAIYYKQTIAAVRDGRLEGTAASNALRALEDGLRSAKFLSIFDGWGRTLGDALQLSVGGQFDKIKSNGVELQFDKQTFEKFAPKDREALTQSSVLTNMYSKLLELPDIPQSVAGIIEKALGGDATNEQLQSGLDQIKIALGDAFPKTDKEKLDAVTVKPEHYSKLTTAIEDLTKVMLGGVPTKQLTSTVANEDRAGEAEARAFIAASKVDPVTGQPKGFATSEQKTAAEKRLAEIRASGVNSGISGLKTPADQIAADIATTLKKSQDAGIIHQLPRERQEGIAERLASVKSIGIRTTENSAKYDAAVREFQDYLDASLESIKDFSKEAGSSFSSNMSNTILQGLQASLSGKNASEGGITLPMLVQGFTRNVTDSFAKGMTKSITRYTDTFFERLGESLFKSGAELVGGFIKHLQSQMMVSSGSGGFLGAVGNILGLIGGDAGNSGGYTDLEFATGGLVNGPGSGTSDSILAKLSNGEFVVNAEATKRFGGLLQRINEGNLPHYASGGLVGYAAGGSELSASVSTKSPENSSVINLNITGDISRQTRGEIYKMLPSIAEGVNQHNKDRNYRG